jgi:hypothetical protein
MKTIVTVVTNPSSKLLKLIRDAQERKECDLDEIRANKHLYFPKK